MQHLRECEGKTDEELVELLLVNQHFYLCLMRRYEDKLMRYIRRISDFYVEEAEDILQEVFLKVYQNINNFDFTLKFSSWIYRITHNQVISYHRRKEARPKAYDLSNEEFDVFDTLVSEIDLELNIDQDYLRQSLNKVLENIDGKYREVLILKYWEQKDYQEISDILKKPIGTVGTLLNRAKQKFKSELVKQNINL